jgi:hypothetical protein
MIRFNIKKRLHDLFQRPKSNPKCKLALVKEGQKITIQRFSFKGQYFHGWFLEQTFTEDYFLHQTSIVSEKPNGK